MKAATIDFFCIVFFFFFIFDCCWCYFFRIWSGERYLMFLKMKRINEMILIICDFSCLLNFFHANVFASFLHLAFSTWASLGPIVPTIRRRNYNPLFHN